MPWKHVFDPTRGLVTNRPASGLEPEMSPYMKGIALRDGEVRSDYGMSGFPIAGLLKSNQLNGTVMRIDQFFLLNGVSHLLAFTTNCLYQYNTTTSTWDVVHIGTLIDDAEAAWDAAANVTSTADTSIKLRGSASAKHVIAAAFLDIYAHYKLNDDADNTTVVDYGSGDNNGVASSNTSIMTTTGKIGGALTFGGNGDNVDLDSLAAGIASDTAGSIALWFKTTSTIAFNYFVSFSTLADASSSISIYTNSSGRIIVSCINDGSYNYLWQTSTTGHNDGTLRHFAVSHNGTVPTFYVNGVAHTGQYLFEVDKTVWMSGITGMDSGTLGGLKHSGALNLFNIYKGDLDDFRYYQSALSAGNVSTIYNSGSGTEAMLTSPLISSEDDLQNADISAALNTYLSFWIYSDNPLTADTLRVRLSEQATGGTGATYADYSVPAVNAGTWKHCLADISSPVASDGGTYPTDLNALASVALIASGNPGVGSVYIDDIRTIQKFTGDEDNKFSVRTLHDTMVVTNGVDAPTKITSGPTHAALTLSLPAGAITTCEVVIPFKDHMLYMNNTENGADAPQRVSWSNIGDLGDHVGGTAGFQDLIDDEGWIVGAEALTDNELAIYKEFSIVQCVWVGGHTPFRFRTLVSGLGAMNKDCIAETEGGHTVLGTDTIYEYRGDINVKIIDDPIKRTLFTRLDGAYTNRAFLMYIAEDSELQFFIPATQTTPDEAYVYNTADKNWYRKDRNISGFGYYKRQSSLTIGDLVGTIGEQNWTFGSQLVREFFPITLVGDVNGRVYLLDPLTSDNNGVAIESEFQTPDFVLPDEPEYMNKFMRLSKLIYEASGQSITTEWSSDGGLIWNATQGASSNVVSLMSVFEDYEQSFEANVKRIRFRFKNTTAASSFRLKYYGFFWMPRTGRR